MQECHKAQAQLQAWGQFSVSPYLYSSSGEFSLNQPLIHATQQFSLFYMDVYGGFQNEHQTEK